MDQLLHSLHNLLIPEMPASDESTAELVKRLRHIADVLAATLDAHAASVSLPVAETFEVDNNGEALAERRLSSTQAEGEINAAVHTTD